MNEQDKAVLDRILTLNPEDLSDHDRKFLNARRTYLTNDQKRIFDSVIVKEGIKDEDINEDGVYVAKKDRK